MRKNQFSLAIGSLLESPAMAIGNEINEDLIFSEDAFSSLGAEVPEEVVLEALKIGQIPMGTAAITSGGSYRASHIVHFATCSFDGVASEQSIVDSVRDGLSKCKDYNITSLALPEIGRFTCDLPLRRIAELLFSECIRHNDREITLERIYFQLSDRRALDIFEETIRQI